MSIGVCGRRARCGVTSPSFFPAHRGTARLSAHAHQQPGYPSTRAFADSLAFDDVRGSYGRFSVPWDGCRTDAGRTRPCQGVDPERCELSAGSMTLVACFLPVTFSLISFDIPPMAALWRVGDCA